MESFTLCFQPERIYNRYTHSMEYVPCGKCPACLNSKASSMANRVRAEIVNHRFALFFTLTYDNESIPRFEIFQDIKGHNQIRPVGRLVDSYSSYPLSVSLATDKTFSLSDDCFVPYIENYDVLNEFGVVSKYDIQLFLKRLRYKVSKSNLNEKEKKFRYFIASEYGPTTFRPHYHGIFFFNDAKLLSVLKNALLMSWGYSERVTGKVNRFIFRPFASTALTSSYIKLCDANTAYYVASYVAGNTNLPEVLRHSLVRPFSLYSQSPCFGSCQVDRKKMLEDVSRGVITFDRVRTIKSTQSVDVVTLPYSKSNLCTVFRKCKGYRTLSSHTKSYLYSFVYDHKQEWLDHVTFYARALKCKSVKQFVRKYREFSLRNYLKSKYFNYYNALEMDDDSNWYASLYCDKMIRSYPIFRCGMFASPVDCYIHLMDKSETLKKSYSYGKFVENLNSWIDKFGPVANLAGYTNVFHVLDSNVRYFNQLPFEFKNFVNLCGLRHKIVFRDGRLCYDFLQENVDTSSQVFVNYQVNQIKKFNDRTKQKKCNNQVLFGLRKIS